MPTKAGKPQVGERVRAYERNVITGRLKKDSYEDGTVVHRTDGILWSMAVKWDSGRRTLITEAGYYMAQGWIQLLPKEEEQ